GTDEAVTTAAANPTVSTVGVTKRCSMSLYLASLVPRTNGRRAQFPTCAFSSPGAFPAGPRGRSDPPVGTDGSHRGEQGQLLLEESGTVTFFSSFSSFSSSESERTWSAEVSASSSLSSGSGTKPEAPRGVLYWSGSMLPSGSDTIAGFRARPATFTALRPGPRIGSTAQSSHIPYTATAREDRIRVNIRTGSMQ